MKKRTSSKSSSQEVQVKPDMAELIIKIQQQLVFLEKKIDTLISQSVQKPFEEKPHVKPLQHFKPPHGNAEAGYGRDRERRTLFRAICADCNKQCEVPFRPTQGRPVYCQQCFSKRKVNIPTGSLRDTRPWAKPREAADKASSSFKPSHYDRPRSGEIIHEHPFNKYLGSPKHRPGQKPAFKKRKK